MANLMAIEILRPRLAGFRKQAKSFATLRHPGLKGRLREVLLREIIEPFLPPLVVVKTGTIVDSGGERKHRTQDDVVLFSRARAPLLWEAEDSIMPMEGVLATVDVKTKLTRRALRSAAGAAMELGHPLVPHGGKTPLGIVFAYTSDLKRKTSEARRLLDVLEEIGFSPKPRHATSPIQLICVADRGTWVLTGAKDRSGWWFVKPDGEHHLLAFLSILSDTVYRPTPRCPGSARICATTPG